MIETFAMEREMSARSVEVTGAVMRKETEKLPKEIGESLEKETEKLPKEIGGSLESEKLPKEIGERVKEKTEKDDPENTKVADVPENPLVREQDQEKVFDPDKRVELPVDQEVDVEKIEKPDSALEQIEKEISTKDGLKGLKEKHPEKSELWDRVSDAMDTLNNPEASVLEKNSAKRKMDSAKGQILEIATKDALTDAGLDVESTQRNIDGESGKTRPDVIAHNNADKPIEVLGTVIQPGESLFVECKCGIKDYLNGELKNQNDIPNQLSGHEGKSVLLTTSDMKDTQPGLAEGVCNKYNTKLVISDVSVKQVESTMKEVFGK
ncbi:MAG: hypothetical protein NC121_03700 [Blautia sp.]|nr:hypothetical protein [Blautia sp.]